METVILTKKLRLTYEDGNIVTLGIFNENSKTRTKRLCFETDDMPEMKTKLATLGLTPDPRTNPEFV